MSSYKVFCIAFSEHRNSFEESLVGFILDAYNFWKYPTALRSFPLDHQRGFSLENPSYALDHTSFLILQKHLFLEGQ